MKGKTGRTLAGALVIAIIAALAIGLGFQIWRFFNFTLDAFVASAAVNLTDTLLAGVVAAATVILLFVTIALLAIAESIGRVAKAIETKSLIDTRGLRIVFTNRDGCPESIIVEKVPE
jgi:hypothetical protein